MTSTAHHEAAVALRSWVAALRAERAKLLAFGDPLDICLAFIDADPRVTDTNAYTHLKKLSGDLRDYAISSAYALLIGNERRKALSAYFTPPALADATIKAALPYLSAAEALVADPACGGGSFLVPIARAMISRRLARGQAADTACAAVVAQIRGIEIESGLATLSERLLHDAILREFGVDLDTSGVVQVADTLAIDVEERFSAVIGNPPYSKVWTEGAARIRSIAGKAHVGGHTNLYGLFVLRALDWLKPRGGLAFVLPTSFIAGPYYAGLRQEILERADVVRIDVHQQREDLFIDAVQDVCLLVLERRGETEARRDQYELGLIDAGSQRTTLGSASLPAGGEAWLVPATSMPRSADDQFALMTSQPAAVLASYGYRVRVGNVVPHRETKRLFEEPAEGRLPVLWASDIRPNGAFQFRGGRKLLSAWYEPPDVGGQSYISKGRAVIVQRTANRDQRRRLNACAVSESFLSEHAAQGYVAENHVIVIEPIEIEPEVGPDQLAAILNSAVVSERFSAVAGSFSVSAKLLARLALPSAETLPPLGPNFEAELAACFAKLDGVLASKA